jgi:hypothetical protein
MSNSKSSLTSTVLEASGVLLDNMSQRPLTVGQALLITFGLFVLAWSIYIGFFLLAVRIGILEDPSETDPERGHDSYALTPQFVRMYEEWITMLRFEPYEIDGVEKRYAEELAREYGTIGVSGGVIVV